MTRLIDRFTPASVVERSSSFTWGGLQQFVQSVQFGGLNYALGSGTYGKNEQVTYTLDQAVRSNPIVFGIVDRRASLISQARWSFRRTSSRGMPTQSDLFGTPALAPLDRPKRLMTRLEWDVATAGSGYVAMKDNRVVRLRPEWVTLVHGSNADPDSDPEALASDAELVALVYAPPSGRTEVFTEGAGQFGIYAPIPDQRLRSRGMSWVEACLSEVEVDAATRGYVKSFYAHAATPNLVVSLDPNLTKDQALLVQEMIQEEHGGVSDAFKTLVLAGGAKPTVIGSSLKDLDQESITRLLHASMAVAAGVPAIVAGVIPGLESSTFSNYNQAFRSFGDLTGRSLWEEMALALSPLIDVPADAELWPDTSMIAALQDDAKDDAEIMSARASTIRTLSDGGFEPDTVVEAVVAGDFTKLIHTGKTPVQLHDPNATDAGGAEGAEGGESENDDRGDDASILKVRVDGAAALIRSGFEPAAALEAMGLDPIEHLGLLPVTLQSKEKAEEKPAGVEDEEGEEGDELGADEEDEGAEGAATDEGEDSDGDE